MRVRVYLEVPTLYLDLTPAEVAELDRTDAEDDWQPFIDAVYPFLEDHLLNSFTIEEVVPY